MLKEIKLDDRGYKEIRNDAVEDIVKHCPEWTNHNVSDPGITIIELLSSMSEEIIERLNKVPEKNYLAFLDLIGIKQRLPRPSATHISFGLSEGHQATVDKKDSILIKEGSVIASEPKGDEEVVLFETLKNLHISNVKLINIYSKTFNTYRQRNDIVNNMEMLDKGETFKPFSSQGASDNLVQIHLSSDSFEVFGHSAKNSLVFRLPTTMRLYNISDNFLQNIKWEFYNGTTWEGLKILNDFFFSLDDKDADILSVTFLGENESFQKWLIEEFGAEEKYYLRGTIEEAPSWLKEFSIYEMSIMTSSYDAGVLPAFCFNNYTSLNLNNDFYPFSSRPKVDDKMKEEIFYINSNEAFEIAGTSISIGLKQSLNPEYILPKGNDNLRLLWEYPVGVGQWSFLKVSDSTKLFSKDGQVDFEVPEDSVKVDINGEEGFWVRCRLADGNYGAEEKSEYNEQSASVMTTPSTLRPPVFSDVMIKYTKPRSDIKACRILNNFQYNDIVFVDDIPSKLFDAKSEKEEALFLGFDSYLSEDILSVYFDINNSTEERNLFTQQRVIEWYLLQEGEWIKLEEIVDTTDGLTASGNVTFTLPLIEKLESNTLYIEEFQRMWIKAKVKFNSLSYAPDISAVLLNTTAVIQQETFYDELMGRSDGLPDLKFALNYKNLSSAPQVMVGEDEFRAVDRFIDYGKNDKIFRFNGIDGLIEFGDGEFGEIPKLGESVTIKSYSITQGKEGNVGIGELSVLRESVNYLDTISNYKASVNGENGDTLNDLKKYAPAVLKTMDRAISIEDYELLCENFSPAIKKAKCLAKDGDVIIVPMTETIIQDKGFINKKLLDDLKEYLQKRSLLTVEPILVPPVIVGLTVYLKLLYTVENYNVSSIDLESSILENSATYFDPFRGYKGNGFPMGKLINKADFYTILHETDNNVFINEIQFSLNSSKSLIQKVNLSHHDLVRVNTVIIEELSYDI